MVLNTSLDLRYFWTVGLTTNSVFFSFHWGKGDRGDKGDSGALGPRVSVSPLLFWPPMSLDLKCVSMWLFTMHLD